MITRKGGLCVTRPRPDGYVRVKLKDISGEMHNLYMHRIVAKLFCPAIEGKTVVNHKRNKT